MASVLNKTTFQFMPSVNTPDFMGGNWLINPDMSAVSGTDSKYWTLDVTPAVYDGDTLISAETDIVRIMNDTEKAAYDLAHPAPIVPLPGYIYDTNRGVYLSLVQRSVVFSSMARGGKNFYLSLFGQMSSNIHGYSVLEDSMLVAMECRVSNITTANVTFTLKDGDTVIHSTVLPAGQELIVLPSLSIRIAINAMLSCFIEGAEVNYPLCRWTLSGVQ